MFRGKQRMADVGFREGTRGATSAYGVESYGCKTENKPKNRQRHFAKQDDATGEILPKRGALAKVDSEVARVQPVTTVVGPS